MTCQHEISKSNQNIYICPEIVNDAEILKKFIVLNIVSTIISFLRVCKLFNCKSINVCSLN